jgi:hypothetical protein
MGDRLRRIGDIRVNKLGFALAVALLGGLVAAVLGVAGVGSASPPPARGPSPEEPNAHVFHVQVDGRQVSCIMVDPPKDAVAMSCDWGQR